jgi:hypothetical protein
MLRFSTDLVNFLQAGGSLKEAFEDAILSIYTGTQPSSADGAVSGTLLAQITKGSGSFTYGSENSLPRVEKFTVTNNSAGTDTVTIDSIDTSVTGDGVKTVVELAAELVRGIETNTQLMQKVIPILGESGELFVRSKLAGVDFTPASSGNVSHSNVQAYSRVNSLEFGAVTDGALVKDSETWSGDGIADGTAGWFRMQGKKSSFVIDGSIGTYGSDLNLASTTVSTGVPITISTFTITQPKYAQ